ncbi:MAG: hypothetical protein HQK91_09430 [Nitrospirae bacterium]|nr:hypothetical protein [Nitrospirota bacterium]MBF0541653.1 hypothetical protein [Nitrospirota bacterium]
MKKLQYLFLVILLIALPLSITSCKSQPSKPTVQQGKAVVQQGKAEVQQGKEKLQQGEKAVGQGKAAIQKDMSKY